MALFKSDELKKLNPVETVLALARNCIDPNTSVENEFRLVAQPGQIIFENLLRKTILEFLRLLDFVIAIPVTERISPPDQNGQSLFILLAVHADLQLLCLPGHPIKNFCFEYSPFARRTDFLEDLIFFEGEVVCGLGKRQFQIAFSIARIQGPLGKEQGHAPLHAPAAPWNRRASSPHSFWQWLTRHWSNGMSYLLL